jgi:hypothetical protein
MGVQYPIAVVPDPLVPAPGAAGSVTSVVQVRAMELVTVNVTVVSSVWEARDRIGSATNTIRR